MVEKHDESESIKAIDNDASPETEDDSTADQGLETSENGGTETDGDGGAAQSEEASTDETSSDEDKVDASSDEEDAAVEAPDPRAEEDETTAPESQVDDEIAAAPAETEAPAEDVSEAEVGSATEDGGDVDQRYDATFVTLTPGDIVDGKVVQIDADQVMVDVGYKTEGRIPLHEIGLRQGESPEDVLSPGEDIEVQVLKVDDAEGNVVLSKRRADSRIAWERLEQAHASGDVIEAAVSERVKGGLLADVGVRGFIPASHVSRNYVENLEEYVGQTLRLKVIEIDKQKNNVVLSHKEVLEEEYEETKAETFASLEEGAVVDGIVRRITDFGAFVDIGGGVEGLLHVSEMAWSRVQHPSDVVSENQTLEVKVLKVDPAKERISLSLKETQPDPWDSVAETYRTGEKVSGEVTRVVDFGAFVKLEDGVEGLVHVSQLADHHVADPNDIVQSGEAVEVYIVSVDPERRRIGLSLREPGQSTSQSSRRRPRREKRDETVTSSGDSPSVTLGDMFGDLSSFFDNDDD